MNNYDQLLVFVDEITNGNVYVSVGNSTTDVSMAELELVQGSGAYIVTPNKAFITILAPELNELTTFKIRSYINRRDESTLSVEDMALEIEYIDVPPSANLEEDSVRMLLLVILFATLVIECAILCLCYIR